MIRSSSILKTVGALAAGAMLWRAVRGREEDAARHVTYPPLDTLKPVAQDVWIVDSGPISAFGLKLPVRMTVIRLSGGELVLHSPTVFTPGLARELDALGTVSHLIAPASAHWSFLAGWQRACPDAVTWAAPGLRDRAPVRRSEVRLERDLGDAAPEEWAQDIDQGVVRGIGFTEVWFFHRPSRTLVLTDLIEDLEPGKLSGLASAMMRASLATRGTTGIHIRATLWPRRQDARNAVARMVALEPERVIFAHGRYFAERGNSQLQRAFAWLLGSDRADLTVRDGAVRG